GTLEERRSELLTTYVERMFVRRGAGARYRPEQTVHWLVWLACALSQHSQVVFYLENLQPDWLPSQKSRWQYALVDRLGWGSSIGLLSGLLSGLVVGLPYGLVVGLLSGLAGGVLGGLMVGLTGGKSETSAE